MSDELSDPPRKFYGLKAREFDAVNGPPRPPAPDALPAGPDPGITAAASGPITVEALNRAAAGTQPILGPNGPAARPNDVHDLLELNRRKARAAGEFDLNYIPPRASRRKRDYWILVILANGGSIGFMGLITRFDAAAMLGGLAGGLFLTFALTWIMWFVMDNY